MTWPLLITLATIVFINRYIFLEPNTPVRIPKILHEALDYSAPCLLTAICGPIILMNGDTLRNFPENPYFWGAITTVLVAIYVRQMVTAVLISLLIFYTLVYLI
ncbi:AzlD domain-containing protein [Pseudomonas sp. TTU2014-080ASC]|uniref:AzlD domain-containing protein n=1 Tax=Pseudomonas sp. TTU2014-080ASC TaxID=1729724 RepID=UPI0007189B74|nr:branched-chain amino acid transporter [Pseudomonas sp. TTU2014-080ASC]